MGRIVVQGGSLAWDGAVGRGGHIMFILQWLEALKRSGYEVVYCDVTDGEASKTSLFGSTISEWWTPALSSLVLPSGEAVYGLDARELERFGREAAALITLGCPYSKDPYPWLSEIRPRILIDVDPAFTHLWAVEDDPNNIFGE